MVSVETVGTGTEESRYETWWGWFTVALYVLLTLDMLTTIGVIAEYGISAEQNPLMRYVYSRGVFLALVVNLLALLIAVLAFRGVTELANDLSPPWEDYFQRTVEIWLGLMISLGLVVFVNNMTIILLGQSIFRMV